jgi:hypothetical protein
MFLGLCTPRLLAFFLARTTSVDRLRCEGWCGGARAIVGCAAQDQVQSEEDRQRDAHRAERVAHNPAVSSHMLINSARLDTSQFTLACDV